MANKSPIHKLIIAFAVLLVALSISYYYLYYLPNMAKQKREQEALVSESRKECASAANNQSLEHPNNNRFIKEVVNTDKYEIYYKNCLRSNGLEK